MPQALANILIHLIYSTEDRQRFITDAVRDEPDRIVAAGVNRRTANRPPFCCPEFRRDEAPAEPRSVPVHASACPRALAAVSIAAID
jgi:hypothetical protein